MKDIEAIALLTGYIWNLGSEVDGVIEFTVPPILVDRVKACFAVVEILYVEDEGRFVFEHSQAWMDFHEDKMPEVTYALMVRDSHFLVAVIETSGDGRGTIFTSPSVVKAKGIARLVRKYGIACDLVFSKEKVIFKGVEHPLASIVVDSDYWDKFDTWEFVNYAAVPMKRETEESK